RQTGLSEPGSLIWAEPPAAQCADRHRTISTAVAGHGVSRDPARRPGGLEIEPPGDAVDVQDFAGEKQAGANPALHRPEIHFVQADPPAGHKLLLVQTFSGHEKFRAQQLPDEPMLRG